MKACLVVTAALVVTVEYNALVLDVDVERVAEVLHRGDGIAGTARDVGPSNLIRQSPATTRFVSSDDDRCCDCGR